MSEDKDGYLVEARHWVWPKYMMERWMDISMEEGKEGKGRRKEGGQKGGKEGKRQKGRTHPCMHVWTNKNILSVYLYVNHKVWKSSWIHVGEMAEHFEIQSRRVASDLKATLWKLESVLHVRGLEIPCGKSIRTMTENQESRGGDLFSLYNTGRKNKVRTCHPAWDLLGVGPTLCRGLATQASSR